MNVSLIIGIVGGVLGLVGIGVSIFSARKRIAKSLNVTYERLWLDTVERISKSRNQPRRYEFQIFIKQVD